MSSAPGQLAHEDVRDRNTARTRITALLDSGTFQELGRLTLHDISDVGRAGKEHPGDGVVAGLGKIHGRGVAVYAQDATVLEGLFSQVQSQKTCKIVELAQKSGIPVIGLLDAGTARIQHDIRSLAAHGELLVRNVMASGVIPQISVLMGPCVGGAAFSAALTDFVVMLRKTSFMFITDPDVTKAAIGEQVDNEILGGVGAHTTASGVAHFAADDEASAFHLVKDLLSYLPQNNHEYPPRVTPYDDPARRDESLNSLVPEDSSQPYDMRQVVGSVFDRGSFLEVQAHYAENALIGFARLDGFSVGIVANQPQCLAGVLDVNSADKIARFVCFCDAFNLPVITFVDCPGCLPGVTQEHKGVIRHGAKMIHAYCEATVPKISVILRKAMGGAYIAMSSKQMRTDLAYAWPSADIAVMGPEGAIQILYRNEIKRAPDPMALRRQLLQEYVDHFHNPYSATDMGQIDEVIDPSLTRLQLIMALEILRSKVAVNPAKKHSVMPV